MFEYANLDGKKKTEFVKQIHEKARLNIEQRTEQYTKQANKGHHQVVFEPGDWVWVHIRNKRFPTQKQSKLFHRGDGLFQVLERINDNAYKLDLPDEYNVSANFNVTDLSLFYVGDDLTGSYHTGHIFPVSTSPYIAIINHSKSGKFGTVLSQSKLEG